MFKNEQILKKRKMENPIDINIKKLPEGNYIATSENYSEVIVCGKNISEALEAAKNWINQITKN